MGGATLASDSLYSVGEYFLQTALDLPSWVVSRGGAFDAPWATDSIDGDVCNQAGCPNRALHRHN